MTEKVEKQKVIYRFGQFEINADEGFFLREGEIVPLTPKIFEMLLLLVKNNGRMLSKDEIMETIWADSFVEETNLTSNISRLRKILHAGGEQFIETFPKRGYRFCGEVEEFTGEFEIVKTRRVTTRIRQIVEEAEDFGGAENGEFLRLAAIVPNNLTAPQTRLIGREREIAEIEKLLAQTDKRLITLTGIGGTGKTRIAQEIARRMLAEFADGCFFVALADIRNPEFVAAAVAQIFNVKESDGKFLIENLANFLREKQMLLVVDNFEQVVAAAPVLSEILKAAPGLKILATSRILLHLPSEQEFVVPPLDVPEIFAGAEIENLASCESVKLFVERARAAKAHFVFDKSNAAACAEICSRLEGLPLAIELAAARIKILSPAQILERLDNRLKLLTGGAKELPTRQQTMRGAIEWSYDLLDETERVLMARLAVFAGGLTVEAAESIVSGQWSVVKDSADDRVQRTADGEQRTIDILNGITSLVENSLLIQTENANGERRFRLLEVVREYALEILEASGEADLIKQKHAAFYLAFAEEAESKLYGEQTTKWLDRFEEEHDNVRAVLSRSIVNDVETAINLVGAIRRFWILHNHLTEGRKWMETALERSGNASAEMRFKLLHGIGQAALYQGDADTARKIFEENLSTGKTTGDLRQIALSYRGLGGVAKERGNIAAARNYIEEGLKISREANDKFGIAVSLNNLGDLARMENDFAAARPLLEESLSLSRQLKNKEGICGSLNNLGAAAYGEGDYRAARSHFAEAITTARELGDKVSVSYSLDGFAALAAKGKDFAAAARLAGAAEHIRESLGFEIEPAERHFRNAYLADLRLAITEEKFSEAYRQGCQMKIEKAVALIIGDER